MSIAVKKLTLTVIVTLLGVLPLIACDPGVTITVENHLEVPVIFGDQTIALDYSGHATPVALTQVRNPPTIAPGKTQEFIAFISPKRERGSEEKYIMYAVDEGGHIVYERVFTWDELNDLGWKIVIEPGYEP